VESLPRVAAALSLLSAACSASPTTARSATGASSSLPEEVIFRADLSILPRLEGRLDEADHAAAAVVLGLRRIDDACGAYLDVRLAPELHLGGREASEPVDPDELVELRAILALPTPAGRCGEARAATLELSALAVGDRVVVALGQAPRVTRPTAKWKRKPRIMALAPIEALPAMIAVLPSMQLPAEGEQFLPVPRMPGAGTPASSRLLGKNARFEVRGGEIVDHAQGLVWQRDEARTTMSLDEAALHCQAQDTGGHRDFRLPTALEMHGLFSPSAPPPALADPTLFAAPEEALFWTRTDDDGAWVGHPHRGVVISTHYDDPSPYGNYHVRCVRPGKARATEMVDRFARRDGVLLDASSGLGWHLGPQKSGLTHEAARAYCDRGVFGAFDDWRLPSPEEAFSLMSACPAALHAWEGEGSAVWTSTIDPERKVGATFDVCDLSLSVPLAAIFEHDGVDPKDPLARVMCARTTAPAAPPAPLPCPPGSALKTRNQVSVCEDQGVRHGAYRSTWPSGGVFEMATYERGLRSGVSMSYHEDGSEYARRAYVSGTLDGEVWAKRPTGAFSFKGAYEKGLPVGRWTWFDPDGREVESIDMVKGHPGPGRLRRYEETGEASVECPTLGGWEHGVMRVLGRADGGVLAESSYRGGWLDGPATTFDGAGGGTTGSHHRDEREGLWRSRDRDGHLVLEQSWHEDALDGVQTAFDAQGRVTSSKRYRNGLPVGRWETKDGEGHVDERAAFDDEGTGTRTTFERGELRREESYVRGKKHGTWRVYGKAQRLRSQAEYREDALVSAVEWYEDGKVRERRSYAEGRMHGLFEAFDARGNLRQRGRFEQGQREGHWELTTMSGRHFEATFAKGIAVRVTLGTGGTVSSP
jgi:antitoxin component YwqK of YwqJK toxin-antitoxin module